MEIRRIVNGTIVTEREIFPGDLILKDGRIADIIRRDAAGTPATLSRPTPAHRPATGASEADASVLDATGLLVLPGAVDAHVHLQLPVMGLRSADTVFTGTRAAACGGVTTVIDFAQQEAGRTLLDAVHARKEEFFAGGPAIDWSLHVSVTDVRPDVLDEFQRLPMAGIASIKLYMVYAGIMVRAEEIRACLLRAAETGLLTAVHAEDPDLLQLNLVRLRTRERREPFAHYLSRPEETEAAADRLMALLAQETGAEVYIVHLADKGGLEALKHARNAGARIHLETCPHYLQFTRDVLRRPDGCLYVCSPPMKGVESLESLWQALADGSIDVAATDHCPFQRQEKMQGRDDFERIPNGLGGTEILYPYLLDAANRQRIPFTRAVAVCAANPARLFGLGKRKGTIAVGHDADLVLYDPERETVFSQPLSHSAQDHTVWEGMTFSGYPVMTLSRGTVVMREGEYTGRQGYGQFVPAEAAPG